MFFFFFFDELYNIKEIKRAFTNICLDKMLIDGYFDFNEYIYRRLTKDQILEILNAEGSRYRAMYKIPFPKRENAATLWRELFPDQNNNGYSVELSYNESRAIVNWVYRIVGNANECEAFTEEIFRQIKELHGIENQIKFRSGVAYNAAKVNLQIFNSLSQISSYFSSIKLQRDNLFFRGHADANYLLRPSIMRTPSIEENESEIYQQVLINCPDDFEKCRTHFENLVKMQHYELPTRLLDITRNMLVALFFACESHFESYGELLIIMAEKGKIKFPQSDTVSIISSLPVFPKERQDRFREYARDTHVSDDEFNDKILQLIQEVRQEKPAFRNDVRKEDILSSFIVFALKNNNRIVKQDGAFIICGLSTEKGSLNDFRYSVQGKKVVVLINNKKQILDELERCSINRSTLFPEIECVAQYLKDKYNI